MEVGAGVSYVVRLVLTMRLMVRPSENWWKILDVNANQLMLSASGCVLEANHSWSVSTFLMVTGER